MGPLIERPVRGAAGDDVLDACALTLIARRLATGAVERLGDGRRDAKGLRMEIVI
jgi:predicted RNase H-like nuclease